MKQILVPTDFSTCADNAIQFAVQSSKMFPATITLLHSYEVNSNLYTDYVGLDKEFTNTVIKDAGERLAQIKKQIEETDGIVLETLISTKSLQEGIIDVQKSKSFDLIVMGTLGASGITEKLFGSNTATVIGTSRVPVMAIPIAYKWQIPKKILFASSRSEKSPHMLDFIFELTKMYRSHIQVVIYTDEEDEKPSSYVWNDKQISSYQEFLKERYEEEMGSSVHLYGDDFDETLQDFITKNKIDMLVMVTYAHKFCDRFFNPSRTKKMSHHTFIPLLAIPAKMG